jgi:hypothetical protein
MAHLLYIYIEDLVLVCQAITFPIEVPDSFYFIFGRADTTEPHILFSIPVPVLHFKSAFMFAGA